MIKPSVIGLDLAKNIFHLAVLNRQCRDIKQKRLRRAQLAQHFAKLPPTHIAMEACGSSHYWARVLQAQGHQVELLPPQHVKAYLRGQKNDYNDAHAIAEASLHQQIRPVPIKTVEQQDEQMLHRMREQLIRERTALANQLRGLLLERGFVIRVGITSIRKHLPEILESDSPELTVVGRRLLTRQYARLLALDEEVSWYAQQLRAQVQQDDVCQRLSELPGFGLIVSSAFKSWIGSGTQFKTGREASAALGLVPRQHSTGGKPRLGRITKRGNKTLRSQLIHGARAVVRCSEGKADPLSRWINRLKGTRGVNKATVALANKLCRVAWVLVSRGERYAPVTV